MKNDIMTKRRYALKREAGINVVEFIQGNEKIFRGAVWGISIMALIISMINLKAVSGIKSQQNEILMVASESDGHISTEQLRKIITSEFKDYYENNVKLFEAEDSVDAEQLASMSNELEKKVIARINEVTEISGEQEKEIKLLIEKEIAAMDTKDLKGEFEKASNDLVAMIENENASIKLLQAEGSKHEAAIKSNVEKLESIDGKIHSQTNVIEKNKTAIEANSKEVMNQSQRIDNQKNSILDNAKNIDSNKQMIGNNKAAIDNNKSLIEAGIEKLNGFKGFIDNNKGSIETNGQLIAANTESIEELKRTRKKESDDLADVIARASENDKKLAEYKKYVDAQEETLNLYKQLIDANGEKLDVYEQAVEKNAAAIEGLKKSFMFGDVPFTFDQDNGFYGYRIGTTFYPF